MEGKWVKLTPLHSWAHVYNNKGGMLPVIEPQEYMLICMC